MNGPKMANTAFGRMVHASLLDEAKLERDMARVELAALRVDNARLAADHAEMVARRDAVRAHCDAELAEMQVLAGEVARLRDSQRCGLEGIRTELSEAIDELSARGIPSTYDRGMRILKKLIGLVDSALAAAPPVGKKKE